MQNAPLCRTELRGVSVTEIVECEALLMKGLNYQFRCHHPYSALHALAVDYTSFASEQEDRKRAPSPSDVSTQLFCEHERTEDIMERASAVVQRAIIFSDVSFLYAPGHIGFAAVAVALGSATGEDGYIGDNLMRYLEDRFSRKTPEELQQFECTISRVIRTLYQCPLMDLAPAESVESTTQLMAQRAEEMKQVLGRVANLRHQLLRQGSSWAWQPRKRSRLELEFTPPRQKLRRKSLARVTPVGDR